MGAWVELGGRAVAAQMVEHFLSWLWTLFRALSDFCRFALSVFTLIGNQQYFLSRSALL